MLRCSLLDWISLTRKQIHLRSLLEEEWNSIEREEIREETIKREWFGRLRNSFREREKVKLELQMRIFKEEKEKELKHARNLVFVRRKEVLLKTTLQVTVPFISLSLFPFCERLMSVCLDSVFFF